MQRRFRVYVRLNRTFRYKDRVTDILPVPMYVDAPDTGMLYRKLERSGYTRDQIASTTAICTVIDGRPDGVIA